MRYADDGVSIVRKTRGKASHTGLGKEGLLLLIISPIERKGQNLYQPLIHHYPYHLYNILNTNSPIAKLLVNPGLSIPSKFTNPGNPSSRRI